MSRNNNDVRCCACYDGRYITAATTLSKHYACLIKPAEGNLEKVRMLTEHRNTTYWIFKNKRARRDTTTEVFSESRNFPLETQSWEKNVELTSWRWLWIETTTSYGVVPTATDVISLLLQRFLNIMRVWKSPRKAILKTSECWLNIETTEF